MNIRNRLINFRVTDDELRRLKIASTLGNARCLSDFARSAILDTASAIDHTVEPPHRAAGQLEAFDRRLASLESHMARLLEVFSQVKSADAPK